MDRQIRQSAQSEYSRIFEEIRIPSMTPLMYKTLDSVKLTSAWPSVSSEIISEVIDGGYFVVPHPEESEKYDLFNVFVKDYDCCCGKILGKPRKYRHLSKLCQVVKNIQKDSFSFCDDKLYGMPKDFICERAGRRSKDGVVDKTMLIIVKGMSKLSGGLSQAKKEDLVLWQYAEFGKTKSVYVVSDVIVASSVTLQVTVGDAKQRWEFNGHIPLAFKLTKFRLRPSGYLFGINPAETLPRWSDTECITWEKPSESKDKPFN